MTRHAWVVGLVLLALVGETGCHCTSCWPCGRKWCGSQCGELYWSEWFSLPPDCCDPCTNCGAFCGPNNRFLRRGVFGVRDGMGHYDGYGDDYGGGQSGPEPVEGRPASEELPPANTTSDGYDYNEIGQRVSYDEPVDSPYASRTLGRPRSRMIAR
jgi:hypothetical protein